MLAMLVCGSWICGSLSWSNATRRIAFSVFFVTVDRSDQFELSSVGVQGVKGVVKSCAMRCNANGLMNRVCFGSWQRDSDVKAENDDFLLKKRERYSFLRRQMIDGNKWRSLRRREDCVDVVVIVGGNERDKKDVEEGGRRCFCCQAAGGS